MDNRLAVRITVARYRVYGGLLALTSLAILAGAFYILDCAHALNENLDNHLSTDPSPDGTEKEKTTDTPFWQTPTGTPSTAEKG